MFGRLARDLRPVRTGLIALIWLPALALSAQDLRVSAGTIEDRRTTGQFFGGLEIELKLTGDDLADAKAARLLLKTAVDDTGRDLMPEKRDDPDFQKAFGSSLPDLKANLKNPARAASAVKEISGEVELFIPGRDPASTVVVDKLATRWDKAVASPALKTQKIEVRVVSPKTYRAEAKKGQAEMEKEMEKRKAEIEKEATAAGEDPKAIEALMELAKGLMGMMGDVGDNDLILRIKDEGNKILDVEVTDKAGERISSQGSMSSGEVRVLNFSEKLPADAKVKFLLKTKKSVVAAPFSLKEVALP